MSAPVIREVDGRLVLKGCDPNAMHEVQGQVLIDLVGRCNALREPPTIVGREMVYTWEDVASLPGLRGGAGGRDGRGSLDQARPTISGSDVGKDVINLRLVLDPEDADRLLRWIGDRRGA